MCQIAPAESASHVQLVIQYQRGCQIDWLCEPLSVLSERRGRWVIWLPLPEAAFHGRYRPSQVGRRRLLCRAGTARSSWLGGVTDARRRVDDGRGAWPSAHGSGPRSGSSLRHRLGNVGRRNGPHRLIRPLAVQDNDSGSSW